ncbi:MAG: type II toxin-antitoxin system VapC family toxin [Pseudomonadota bacterium]
MTVYLDANVIIALLIEDGLSARAAAAVGALSEPILVSDLAALEYASAVARRARSGAISAKAAREAFSDFDFWALQANRVESGAGDITAADAIVRRLDINLHGADALHVAIASRLGARLLTLDAKMKANAKKVGVAVV